MTGLPPLVPELLLPTELPVLLVPLPVGGGGKSLAPFGGGGRPVNDADDVNGGADKMEVKDGAEAAKEDIFGLLVCCCFC